MSTSGESESSKRWLQVEIEKPLKLKLKASKAEGGGCVVQVWQLTSHTL